MLLIQYIKAEVKREQQWAVMRGLEAKTLEPATKLDVQDSFDPR